MSTITPFEIPLSATPQSMTIPVNGVVYSLTFKWNKYQNAWVMDIADINNVPIADGIPLVTGADLLSPYGYLGIGCKMIVQSSPDADAVPTFDSLGTTGALYAVFVTP